MLIDLSEKEYAIVENALVHHARELRNAAASAEDVHTRNAFTYDAEDTEALIERFE